MQSNPGLESGSCAAALRKRAAPGKRRARTQRTVAAAALLALLCAVPAGQALAQAQPQPVREASRGELLYTTHCVACHTTKMHWRQKKLATDWPGLLGLVRHWQALAGLGWTAEDIAEVARYLNGRYYHFFAQE